MSPGDHCILVKNTFMYKGIFILSNSTVKIEKIHADGIDVLYHDKEGNPHTISNLQKEDIKEIG
ncbi:MAG: hypothetical protein AAF518_17940 [Spirochaetota bacterium]